VQVPTTNLAAINVDVQTGPLIYQNQL